MPRALRNFLGRRYAGHLSMNPLTVGHPQRRLRRNFLRKESVRRCRRHSPRRRVRLIQISAILQIRHHPTNRRRAQLLFIPLRNRARRHRLARLNICPHNVCQDLPIPPVLERRIPHKQPLQATQVAQASACAAMPAAASNHPPPCFYSRNRVKHGQSVALAFMPALSALPSCGRPSSAFRTLGVLLLFLLGSAGIPAGHTVNPFRAFACVVAEL
jgi:hypothetical protein